MSRTGALVGCSFYDVRRARVEPDDVAEGPSPGGLAEPPFESAPKSRNQAFDRWRPPNRFSFMKESMNVVRWAADRGPVIALPTDGARRPMTSEAAFPTRRGHIATVRQPFTGRRWSEGDAPTRRSATGSFGRKAGVVHLPEQSQPSDGSPSWIFRVHVLVSFGRTAQRPEG